MAGKRDYSKVIITHITADGSVRDSMKGYGITYERFPTVVREILRKIMTERQ